ncbi:hypothetical protein MASR2M66_21890 [Chloroflexota bacterium]
MPIIAECFNDVTKKGKVRMMQFPHRTWGGWGKRLTVILRWELLPSALTARVNREFFEPVQSFPAQIQ